MMPDKDIIIITKNEARALIAGLIWLDGEITLGKYQRDFLNRLYEKYHDLEKEFKGAKQAEPSRQ